MIDVNVYLSRWPFRRLAGDEPAALVVRLEKRKVTRAWAGTFDGIFHKDIAGANSRLSLDCLRYGRDLLIPVGSVNPKLPDWQDDLRRCHEEYKMPAIRLHPNYHGYELSNPVFAELLHMATKRRLVVQIALSMEDVRTQHPLMRVPPVDITPLASVLKNEPTARVVALNVDVRRVLEHSPELIATPNLYFDLAMVEGIAGVTQLARKIPTRRLLFGSNYPLFYFESALLKVRESGLTDNDARALLEESARNLLTS